jgi:hypothetical protein
MRPPWRRLAPAAPRAPRVFFYDGAEPLPRFDVDVAPRVTPRVAPRVARARVRAATRHVTHI